MERQPERYPVAASRLTDEALAAIPDPRDREELVFHTLIDLAESREPLFLVQMDTDDQHAWRRLGYLLDMTNVVLDAVAPEALESLSRLLRVPPEPPIRLLGGAVSSLEVPDYDDFAVRWGIVDPVWKPRFRSHLPALLAERAGRGG